MAPPPRVDIEALAKSLVDHDKSADEVKRLLCELYPSMHSVRTKMTTFRDLVFEASPQIDARALLELESDPSVRIFVNSSRKDQCAIQRQHENNPTWSEAAENLLASFDIVPACIKGLVLTKRECNQLQRKSEQAVVDANMNPYLIEDGDKLLSQIEEKMRAANDSISGLAISILLATGRRTVEILNGVSSFNPVPGEPYHAIFDGQAKKRDAKPYIIPILVPFEVLDNSMKALRAQQGHRMFTSREVKNKYQSTIRKRLLKAISQEELALPPLKVHALRKVYVALVQKLFDTGFAFNATVMKCCGHSKLKDSLAYSCVIMKGVRGEGRLGKMVVSDLCMESESEAENEE